MNLEKLDNMEFSLKHDLAPIINDTGNLLETSEMFRLIGNVTFWISQIDEWYKKNQVITYNHAKKEDNKIGIISGLKHVNNLYKHEKNFIKANTSKEGITFPISFPFQLMHWEWDNIDHIPVEKKNESQRNNYNLFLRGKIVRDILGYISEFLFDFGKEFRNSLVSK